MPPRTRMRITLSLCIIRHAEPCGLRGRDRRRRSMVGRPADGGDARRSSSSSTSATRRSCVDDDGEIAGFLCGFRSQTHDDEAYIHFVGVDPARRGAGRRARALRAVLRGGRAADDRAGGHGAGQRALGRVPSRARVRDRARRRGLRRARRGPRPPRQAPDRRSDPPFGDAAVRPSADHDAAVGVARLPGEIRRAAGRAAALARRLRAAPGRGGGAREARPPRRRALAAQPGRSSSSSGRSRTTRRATRSRRPTRGATTTAGGSTGWCARRARSSSA